MAALCRNRTMLGINKVDKLLEAEEVSVWNVPKESNLFDMFFFSQKNVLYFLFS